MATLAFSALVPELLTYAQGCPDPLAIDMLRAAAVDLCESAPVWSYTSDAVTVAPSDFPYDVDLPDASVRSVAITAVYWNSARMDPVALVSLNTSPDNWHDKTGAPSAYVADSTSAAALYPIPEESGVLVTTIHCAPAWTATGMDAGVANRYRKTIVNGAIARVLAVPNQPFSNPELAGVFGSAYARSAAKARVDANKGFMPAMVNVRARKFV